MDILSEIKHRPVISITSPGNPGRAIAIGTKRINITPVIFLIRASIDILFLPQMQGLDLTKLRIYQAKESEPDMET